MSNKSPGKGSGKSPVSLAKKKRYEWPSPPDPDDVYVPRQRNPIHSILTALPILMLVLGLYFYYSGESEQTDSAPIRELSVTVQGVFTGLSEVNSGISSGSTGRHYLWFEDEGKARGVRIRAEHVAALRQLEKNVGLLIRMAPSVAGSKIQWAWYVEQAGLVLLDVEDTLQ